MNSAAVRSTWRPTPAVPNSGHGARLGASRYVSPTWKTHGMNQWPQVRFPCAPPAFPGGAGSVLTMCALEQIGNRFGPPSTTSFKAPRIVRQTDLELGTSSARSTAIDYHTGAGTSVGSCQTSGVWQAMERINIRAPIYGPAAFGCFTVIVWNRSNDASENCRKSLERR